jgi:hypothetical protein
LFILKTIRQGVLILKADYIEPSSKLRYSTLTVFPRSDNFHTFFKKISHTPKYLKPASGLSSACGRKLILISDPQGRGENKKARPASLPVKTAQPHFPSPASRLDFSATTARSQPSGNFFRQALIGGRAHNRSLFRRTLRHKNAEEKFK